MPPKRKAPVAKDAPSKKAKPSTQPAAPKSKPAKSQPSKPESKVNGVPAPKAASKVPKATKKLPVINPPPTSILDIFVFGEGSAGELGLGAGNQPGGKSSVDVARPRLNHRLDAKNVGVVAIAVGGMHAAALTRDNKILTWGVNDQGALGRSTEAGQMKDMAESEESEDSDSDAGSGLNPSEAEPREVDPSHFAPNTKFAALFAGDSCTYALTTTGLVYGWGTFRVSSFKPVVSILTFCRVTKASLDSRKTC